MNQIENWFGVLQKKVIKHGQFHSVNELEQKIENFILYHNSHLAKPINANQGLKIETDYQYIMKAFLISFQF